MTWNGMVMTMDILAETHILECSYAHQYSQTIIMEMCELWIYRRWTHILESRYARQYFSVRLANNVGSKSFLNFFKTQLDTSPNKAQHKQELLCGKIFDSGRNVYVIEEPFYFHSTPINLKIKVQQD
jgi:hypothetical protein